MVGSTIQYLRENKNMTQRDLADTMGVSLSSVQKWETGVRNICIDQLLQLSKLFNVSTDYILGIKDKDIDVCFYNSLGDLTQEQKKELVQYAQFLRSKKGDMQNEKSC